MATGPERATVASRLARSTHVRREVQHGVEEVTAPIFGHESGADLSKRIGVRTDTEEPRDQPTDVRVYGDCTFAEGVYQDRAGGVLADAV